MILSYDRLVELKKNGIISGDLVKINGASIDVHIGNTILIESPAAGIVDLTRHNPKHLTSVELRESGYLVRPRQIILASTLESLNLPNNLVAHFILKSSIGRCFFNQLQSNHADPGFKGCLTLELKNDNEQHSIRLTPGVPIGQLVFYECDTVPDHALYSLVGQYNTTETSPVQSKGAK